MLIAKISAVGVIAGIAALTVKKTHPELSVQLGIAAGILIFLMAFEHLKDAVELVKRFAEMYDGAYEGIKIVLKVVGVAYISEFASQSLADAGENAIGKKVELASKLIIAALTIPLLEQFAGIVMSLAEKI